MTDNDSEKTKNMTRYFFQASAADFKKIPGSPVAYWLGNSALRTLDLTKPLGKYTEPRKGMCTRDNDYFIRCWQEVNFNRIEFDCISRDKAKHSSKRWFPYQKGGDFRQWYGNHLHVVDWENDGYRLLNMEKLGWKGNSTNHNLNYIFSSCIVWSKITSNIPNFRLSPPGFLFDDASGLCAVNNRSNIYIILAYLCSKVGQFYMGVINPTLNIQPGNMASMPLLFPERKTDIEQIITLSTMDWNSYENAWDFTTLPLLHPDHHTTDLSTTYFTLSNHWQQTTLEMQRLEEENNRIFIEAYGLGDELTPEVPLHEITLTCNPHYRYAQGKTKEEYETLLLTDTMKELISYAIGCMMGRYSLDEPGLVYAHSGNEGFDPSRYKTFPADDDGIVPIMDMEWFDDDATRQFIIFMKTAWPANTEDQKAQLETLNANLKFIAETLNPKAGEAPEATIHRYMSTMFFKDHMKMYKKRPIYWLFSSGKMRAFECLVYLHRYNEATLSRMRSKYVTPLQGNIVARIEYLEHEKDAATTASTQKKLQKEIDLLRKKQTELRAFDDELRHHADMKISLDLDDGVKVNYGRFGNLVAEKNAIMG